MGRIDLNDRVDIYETSPHPLSYTGLISMILSSLITGLSFPIIANIVFKPDHPALRYNIPTWIMGVFGLVLLYSSLQLVYNLAYTTYILDENGVAVRTGILKKRIEKANVDRIETVLVNKTLQGRLLGFGALVINTEGGSKSSRDELTLTGHPEPEDWREYLMNEDKRREAEKKRKQEEQQPSAPEPAEEPAQTADEPAQPDDQPIGRDEQPGTSSKTTGDESTAEPSGPTPASEGDDATETDEGEADHSDIDEALDNLTGEDDAE